MNLRRWIPHGRLVAFVLAGATAGVFVATGIAALAWGFVPPESLRVAGSVAAVIGFLAVIALLMVERRKRDRRKSERE